MSDPALLPCVEIEPEGEANAAVVWLHGLGADGNDFVPIVPHLKVANARYVFPTAPAIPVTINGGMVMPAWYDITVMDLERRHDSDGVKRSAAHLAALIARENERGIPTARILVAGFSQGGAVATYQSLRHPERLAGCIALSTYLVLADSLEAERTEANAGLPVFVGHGVHDPMVPFVGGETSRDRLTALGYDVTWNSYAMQHEVCLEEMQDLGKWMRARLG